MTTPDPVALARDLLDNRDAPGEARYLARVVLAQALSLDGFRVLVAGLAATVAIQAEALARAEKGAANAGQ